MSVLHAWLTQQTLVCVPGMERLTFGTRRQWSWLPHELDRCVSPAVLPLKQMLQRGLSARFHTVRKPGARWWWWWYAT